MLERGMIAVGGFITLYFSSTYIYKKVLLNDQRDALEKFMKSYIEN
jgi:hypothetical protein